MSSSSKSGCNISARARPARFCQLRATVAGQVREDAYTRHLFSTDASMYSIEPLAVVCLHTHRSGQTEAVDVGTQLARADLLQCR